MIRLYPLDRSDAKHIVEWNKGRNAAFLKQWAGRGYEYPLTEEQILHRLESSPVQGYRIYRIVNDRELIGTIELVNVPTEDVKEVTLGRFLIDPLQTGRGFGTQALEIFVRQLFSEYPIEVIALDVFSFNQNAMRCYQKVGFKAVSTIERGEGLQVYHMQLKRGDI